MRQDLLTTGIIILLMFLLSSAGGCTSATRESLATAPQISPVTEVVPTLTAQVTPTISRPARYVTLSELTSRPQQFSDSDICTEGYYVRGFETSALAGSYHQEGNFVYLEPPSIWVAGFPVNVLSDLAQLSGDIYFGKVLICGEFQYDNHYGHLGEYDFQLVAKQVTVVELPNIQ